MCGEASRWCNDCGEIVVAIEDDGSYTCSKCGKFLGGCLTINMEEWKRKKAEKKFFALSDRLFIKNIIENSKSF